MRLGGGLRRTRGKSRGKGRGRGRRKGKGGGTPNSRTALLLGGLALGGWGVGYIVATQFVFPAPPPPADVIDVPDIRGMRLAQARERIEGAGLLPGIVDSLSHPSVAQQVILGQSPLPGQLALPGAEVRMTFSLGPQRRSVPDVVRLDAERARIVLESTGFVVQIDSVESPLPRGRVVEVFPPADSLVTIPTEVQVQVSTGPPVVIMPLVLGLDEALAVARLDSLGLVVGEVQEVFRFGRDQGIVVEQEPAADTELARGATVRLSVGRRGR